MLICLGYVFTGHVISFVHLFCCVIDVWESMGQGMLNMLPSDFWLNSCQCFGCVHWTTAKLSSLWKPASVFPRDYFLVYPTQVQVTLEVNLVNVTFVQCLINNNKLLLVRLITKGLLRYGVSYQWITQRNLIFLCHPLSNCSSVVIFKQLVKYVAEIQTGSTLSGMCMYEMKLMFVKLYNKRSK